MKLLWAIIFLIVFDLQSYSQIEIKSNVSINTTLFYIDSTKISENEYYLIKFMETLTDEQLQEFATNFIVGDIIYKEEQLNISLDNEQKGE
jgi:hypothetical protein